MSSVTVFKKQKTLTCSNCEYEQIDEGQQNCRNCSLVLKRMVFDEGVEFTSQKLDGQKYDIISLDRDISIQAEYEINDLVRLLKLKTDFSEYYERIGESPLRIMRFAYKGFFLDHGRNVKNYAASALYIALRFQKAPFLLMDFSDKLGINVFVLARCYRKLANFLNVTLKLNEKLPSIDPSIYIPRFCKMLPFQEKADEVRETSSKLLKRMKLDWISYGRRPASLCGAAIIIAGRLHGFQVTTSDVCKIVFVCEETLRKRLEEFKVTEVAQLTQKQFEETDISKLTKEMDPPAIQQKKQKKQQLQIQDVPQISAILNIQDSKSDIEHDFEFFENEIEKQIEKQSSTIQVLQNIKLNQQHPLQKLNIELKDDPNLSDFSDQDSPIKYLLSNDEQILKSIKWHDMNETWLKEQSNKPEKLQIVKEKKPKKKLADILSCDDPVESLMGQKKIKLNIEEKTLRELFKQRLNDVMTTDLTQIMGENNHKEVSQTILTEREKMRRQKQLKEEELQTQNLQFKGPKQTSWEFEKEYETEKYSLQD